MDPHLTWNLYRDVTQLFDYPFMVNAYRAGTIVAVTAAIIGWFMVLRRQTFAGHTFALVSFPGAAGAILIGVSATYGFFAFSICAALVIAASSRSGRGGYSEESAGIGPVQAVRLGFALRVLPPATAELLVARPGLSLLAAVAIALLVTWLGLAMSYYNDYPIGFHITSLAFGAYLLAQGWRRLPRWTPFARTGV